MTNRFRVALVLLLCVSSVFLAPIHASAQQYPPGTNTPRPTPPRTPPPRTQRPSPRPTATPRPTPRPPLAACVTVRGEDGEPGTAEYRSEITVEGPEGCAEPGGDITVTIRSDPVRFPTFQAYEDGSFERVFCLPPAVRPGDHTVEVAVEGRGTAREPLLVTGGADGEYCGAGDGTIVLGTTTSNTGGTDRGGALPRTGAGILLMLLWAVVLIGGGTLLATSAWRYAQRRAYVAGRAGRRGTTRLALPAPEIPRIDTSRFVPLRSRVDDGDRGSSRADQPDGSATDTVSEWRPSGEGPTSGTTPS